MDDLQKLRKELHQYPELSGKEHDTASVMKEELKKIGIQEFIEDFSETSFIAVLQGSKNKGNVLFRCELDALPIEESNDFDYRSKTVGVSHKCGHDGHMVILIGLAKKLVAGSKDFGKVYLLYQSAEEIGEGAKELVEAKVLNNLKIDYVFALHNVPGYPKGSIVCKKGIFTPHVESIKIKLNGETSHAGEPDKGKNPMRLINEIAELFLNLHQPDASRDDYFIVAPIFVEMGSRAYGTSAGKAEMGFTLRTFSSKEFDQKRKELIQAMKSKSTQHKIELEWEWIEPFYANNNDTEAYNYIKSAAESLSLHFVDKEVPFDWGEDFGLITQKFKGAMFGLGAGENAKDLHDSNYDFPDDLIPTGVNIFYEINRIIQDDL